MFIKDNKIFNIAKFFEIYGSYEILKYVKIPKKGQKCAQNTINRPKNKNKKTESILNIY